MQERLRPARVQLEDHSDTRGSARIGRAVQIAERVEDNPCKRRPAIRTTGKAIQNCLLAAIAQLENTSETESATRCGRAVEVSRSISSQNREGTIAICRARKVVENCFAARFRHFE